MFPYIQQDARIIRCAQACLASVAKFFGVEGLTGAKITELAQEMPSGERSVPSRGLTVEQMGYTLKKMKRDPIIYDYTRTPEDPTVTVSQHREQIIYRYVESGIPVIIGIEAGGDMHAIVAIGHTFTPDSWLAETGTVYYGQPKTGFLYHCCTNWIERFVVQDDNLGPYTLVPAFFLQYAVCKLIIVPMPLSVFLTGEDAEMFAADLLSPQGAEFSKHLLGLQNEVIDTVDKDTNFWLEQLHKHASSNELVLRTYLRPTNDWISDQKKTESYPEYDDLVSSIPLPEHVWVVEVSWPQIFRHERRICGEIVLDATAQVLDDIHPLEQVWLWMHFPGIVLYRNAQTGQTSYTVLRCPDVIRKCHQTTEVS